MMKDKMDSIRRAMNPRRTPAAKTAPEPAARNEPKLQSKYKPEPEPELTLQPEPEPNLEAKKELEEAIETDPELEPKAETKAELESEPEPKINSKQETSPDIDQYSGESFVVKRMVSLRPDLQFCSLEHDTVLHCQDDSVPAPSLLLVLLAPWLGDVLQAERGQQDSIRTIFCPDLRAESLRRFLADVAARKEEIHVGEDVRSSFLMNLTLERKYTSQDVPEVEMKEWTADEDTNEAPVELKTNSEDRKTIHLKSWNKYKANILSKFEKVCKCALDAQTDSQKIEHFKVTHDIYEKCHKCCKLYIKLIDEIHVCKGPKTKYKQITNFKECSHCTL